MTRRIAHQASCRSIKFSVMTVLVLLTSGCSRTAPVEEPRDHTVLRAVLTYFEDEIGEGSVILVHPRLMLPSSATGEKPGGITRFSGYADSTAVSAVVGTLNRYELCSMGESGACLNGAGRTYVVLSEVVDAREGAAEVEVLVVEGGSAGADKRFDVIVVPGRGSWKVRSTQQTQ